MASASPRRADLLKMLGFTFDRLPADIPENPDEGESPAGYVERLAREKATSVAALRPEALVLAGDTVVVLDGEILEKPSDEEDAVRMLMRLSGRSHVVLSGIAVAAPGGVLESTLERTEVTFRPFDDGTARAYAATGEPMDKAGAYGIQGFGASLVDSISGDYFTVVGLPVARLVELLERTGWRYRFGLLEMVKETVDT
ncbi:MAG: nucleoside triphosphate pyrophosphatase [Gemmatimonadota bacterium]